MKIRLLFCSEASILSSGYAVYAREMLSRLHASGLIEVAEHASYVHDSDQRLRDIPWKVYGNLPDVNNQAEKDAYNSNPANLFGAWKFDDIVLDFRPHVVFDYRDIWYCEHELRSPLRNYFNLVWMLATDSYPQPKNTIDQLVQCDATFTYSDWAIDILKNQTNGRVSPICNLGGGASAKLFPLNKLEIKQKWGLQDYKIIGTVMRNQRRKLFPDLFQSFRKFLDKTNRQDVLLYCHTSYPDKHPWNIPELLNEYGLATKVLLTYRCGNCNLMFPSFFNDVVIACPRCKQIRANTATVQSGCPTEFLNEIYNLFDLYVQYANSEALGIPQLEAGACGIPLMSVDFSAMSDVVRKLGGHPIKVQALYKELETGCMRAVPDNEDCATYFEKFFNLTDSERTELSIQTRANYVQYFSYDMAASNFLKYLTSLNVTELEQKWYRQPRISQPQTQMPDESVTNTDFAKFLICNVLCEPERLGTFLHARLLRDINYGFTVGGMGGIYLNENSLYFAETNPQEFDRQKAFQHFLQLRHQRNEWEKRRYEKMQQVQRN